MTERARGQWILGLLVVLAVIAGLAAADGAGTRPPADDGPTGVVVSGAWYCPHGGGEGWTGRVILANPLDHAVRARVTSFGPEEATEPQAVVVEPGATVPMDVRVTSRGASTMVEYFGGWLAAGWVVDAGPAGVAAEPCAPEAGSWFGMPDGTTDRGHTAYVVIMNPFAVDAIFTVTVYTQARQPLVIGEWRDFVLRPRHSVALELNEAVAGEGAVGASVDASLGRVAAASLGTVEQGGVRAVIGVPDPGPRAVMPGGLDTNTAMVSVLNLSEGHLSLDASVLTDDAEQTGAGIQNQTLEPASARAFSVITSSPSSLDVVGEFESSGGFVAARRTYGVNGDFGATAGVREPAPRWVVLPAVTEPPFDPRLLITNPTEEEAEVELTFLSGEPGDRVQRVTVPARRTVLVPTELTRSEPTSAVLVDAGDGRVVPVYVAYSDDGAAYAVSVGARVPSPT